MSGYVNNNQDGIEEVVDTYMVLDTETTGFKPEEGERIVEIGIIEMKNNEKTGRKFHAYVKPVDENGKQKTVGDSVKVHGLTDEFLSDKPLMAEVMDSVIEFLKGTVVVIHNAPFDVKFLQKELEILEKPSLFNIVKNVHCTLKTDRMLFEGNRHSLDDMCDRFNVSRENRTLHGALLDAELLAECFRITNLEYDSTKIEGVIEQTTWERPEVKRFNNAGLKVTDVDSVDEATHADFIKRMEEKNKKPAIFSVAASKSKLSA